MKIPIKPFVKISPMWTCCHSYPDDCWYFHTLFRSHLRNFIIYIRMAIFWGQFSVHSMTIYYSFPLKAILRLNQWLEFFIDKNKWLLKVQVGIVHLLVSVVILEGCAYFYFYPILFNPIPRYCAVVRMAERSKALRSGRSLPWRRGFKSHFWQLFSSSQESCCLAVIIRWWNNTL